YGQRVLTANMHALYEIEMLGVSNAKDAQFNYAVIGRTLRQAILAPDEVSRQAALKQLAAARANVPREIAELRRRIVREESKKNLARFEAAFAAYSRDVDTVLALLPEERLTEARALVASKAFQDSGAAGNDALEQVVRVKEDAAKGVAEESLRFAERSMQLSLILLAGGLALGILLGILVGRSILLPYQRIRAAVKQLAAGKLDEVVPHTDFQNDVGGLARSITVLQAEAHKMEAQRWIKAHQAEISSELQAATSFTELAQKFLSSVAPLIKIGHGVFFIYEEDQRRLRMLSSYAYRERKNLDQYFALGQGLVGQCALERSTIILSQPPEDYVRIGSSLGEAVPRAIVVLPVLRNERLLAVVELATFDSFGANEQALLDGLMPILAMSLEILERNVRTKVLLEETQRQAENMERQAAKLEEQTVEMEAQQKEILATEAWYRGIIESAPDGMLVVDDQGTIILANPQIEAMFGYETGEFIGSPIEVLVPQAIRQDHVGWRNGFIHQDKTGRANLELRGSRKDGSEFPVEVGLAKLPQIGGRGLCICASVRDVTEKKRIADEIERQRATMSALIDAIVDPIYYKNPEGTYLGCNKAYAERVGKTVDEVVGRLDYDIFAPEIAFSVRNTDQEILESLEKRIAEEWVDYPDGRRVLLDMVRAPFHDGTGQLLGLLGIGRDITDRKASETALRHAAEEQVAIFESLTHGIGFIKDRIILRANTKHAELFGRDMDEIVGQSTRVWYPDDAAYELGGAAVYDDLRRGITHVREQQLQRKDGSLFWCFISARAVDSQDLSRGLVCVLEDITERKRMEDAMKHANMMSDSALDLTKAGYWLIDYSDPDYYTSSERAMAIFGEHPKPDYRYHLTDEWLNRIAEADPKVAEATGVLYAAALEGSVPRYDATYCYKRPIDGRVVWIRAIGNVERDKDGKPRFMYGVTQDVTDMKEAEAKLEERMNELERFNRLTIDREEKMIQLKQEINALLTQMGLDAKYRIVE
ncbi:MAG: PAS domain S-box protein, partial [Proteobacteria bacterium]|nr:PAS domain S-box protein [Pseudomonadota bacterium]